MPSKTDYPQSDNIQGYWKLDEASGNATDYSGNSNTLTDTNSVGTNAEFLAGANCRDFEAGSSMYFTIADGSQTGLDITGSLTCSVWYKGETVQLGGVVGKWPSSGNYSYVLYIDTDDHIKMGVSNNGTTTVYNEGGTTLVAGIWYFLTWRHDADNDELEVFVNSHSDATPTAHTTGLYNGNGAFEVGAYGASNYFDGELAEVVIWNTALTTSEIKQAMEVWRP